MKPRARKPGKPLPLVHVVDASEWASLARRLASVAPEKHDEILRAMRKIVDASLGHSRMFAACWKGSRPQQGGDA